MRRDELTFIDDISEIRDGTLMDLCLIKEYMVESEDGDKEGKMSNKIVEMLSRLIKRLRLALAQLKDKMKKKLSEEKYKMALKKIRNSKGDKQVQFIDVWKYEKLFKSEVRELCRLCDSWQRSYEKFGASVEQANRFEKHYKDIIDTYEPEIEKIKNNKITVSSAKVRKWLLENTQRNGDPAGMLLIYIDRLEACEKSLKEVHTKKEDFIKKTGYNNGSASFTKFVTNSSIYVKRNADWLSMLAVSSLALFVGWKIEKSDKKEIGKYYKPDHTEEKEQKKEKKQFENDRFDDPDYKSKKKTASKMVRKGAAITAAMGGLTKARSANRNSI